MAESTNTNNGQTEKASNAPSDELDPGGVQPQAHQANQDASSKYGEIGISSSNSEITDEYSQNASETSDMPITWGDQNMSSSGQAESPNACCSTTQQLNFTSSPEQKSHEDHLACSSNSSVAGTSNAEASSIPTQCHRDEQYCQASICSCFCTCEHYEEMNDMYETEESMPVCVHCQEISESEFVDSDMPCSCDDNIVIVKPVYAVHCCTCGVQLAHGCESPNQGPEDGPDSDSPNGPPAEDLENVPPPPPPPPLPPQSSYLFLGSRMSRLPTFRRGPNEPPDATGATPTLFLRALTCADDPDFDSRLHEAARAGLAEKLATLLTEDALRSNINSRARPLMATPLREAVVGGNEECVKLLLEAGAAVDAIDVKGQTALFVAASLGRAAIVERLLRARADPEGSRCNNCTPLLLTIREGCVDALQSLLQHGVDPEPVSVLRTCAPGWPLQYCVVYRRLDCFLALLKGGAQPSLAKVLRRAGQNMAEVDDNIVRRLSIARSVLQHASDMPEFIRIYREFGGPVEAVSALPDEARLAPSLARQELQSVYDWPQRLTSLCRICLLQSAGAPRLPALAADFGLPSHLQAFLAFADLDRHAVAECETQLQRP